MPSGRRPKTYPTETVALVAALYGGGSSQSEIASELGTTQKVVWNLMRRHGIGARVAAKRSQLGMDNHMWKGDKASKYAFHRRLYSRLGKPTKCAICGTTQSKHYDYANLSGRYEDMNDYSPMCRSCHWKFDKKHLNFLNRRKGGVECPNS